MSQKVTKYKFFILVYVEDYVLINSIDKNLIKP